MGRTLVANKLLAGSACGKRRRGRPLNSVVRAHEDTMEIRDAVNRIRADLGALMQQGQQFVQIPALLEYLSGIERDAPANSQAAELQHQSQLAYYRAVHETNLEMFKSVMETGQTAVTTAILVCGGGTAALLAYVGNLHAKVPAVPVSQSLVIALICFAVGILSAAMGSGTRYLSQASYAANWRRSGVAFHIACIALVVSSYGLFAWGVVAAYHGFIR